MKREVVVFIVTVVLTAIAVGAGMAALPEKAKQFGGLLAILLLIVPLVMAYVCQRMSGMEGNPFRGLTWGGGSWWLLAWLAGILAAALSIVVAMGFGWMGLDSSMSDYLAMVQKSSGQQMPEQALGWVRGFAQFSVYGGPTVGVIFGAFLGCLGTLPLYGWLGRRLLASSRATAILTLMGLGMLMGVATAFAKNPAFGDMSQGLRCALMAFAGLSGTLAGFWFFLRTRSAFIPAIFAAAMQGLLSSAYIYSADANPLFAPPGGIVVPLVTLLMGIALWVLKDPGGNDMAIGAVSYAGAPPSSVAPSTAPMYAAPPDSSLPAAPPAPGSSVDEGPPARQ